MTTRSDVFRFDLKFSHDAIEQWADVYDYPGLETTAADVGDVVRRRGFLTRDDLVILCRWKSPRIQGRCAGNDGSFVEETTRLALSTREERLRIEILTLLQGVGWPMASVILHWCHADPYPILDFRALWSLGYEQPPTYDFAFWLAYTTFCRKIANSQAISMRTLDKALWAFSKHNQP